jgi:hypothetical protein
MTERVTHDEFPESAGWVDACEHWADDLAVLLADLTLTQSEE